MKYISGWQALNVQSEKGHIADWHSNVYFKDCKPTQMFDYDENSPLGMRGIKNALSLLCKKLALWQIMQGLLLI